MLKLAVAVFCICILFYVIMNSFKKKDEDIDLHDGKSYSASDINLVENEHNFKEFSHTFWMNINKPENGIILHGNTDISYYLTLDNSSKLKLKVGTANESNPKIELEVRNFLTQKWNHIAIVKNLNDIDLYIDGELRKTHEISNITDFTSKHDGDIVIGDYGTSDVDKTWSKSNGLVHGYKFHTSALLQRDVESMYMEKAHSFQNNNSVQSYKFDLNLMRNNVNLGEISI